MAEVVRQRPVGILHPYMIEVYVARDGSVACLSLTPAEGFLRPKRPGEGDKAEAGVQPTRGIRKQDIERCTDPRDYGHTPRRQGNT
jgi:hypothetical protein